MRYEYVVILKKNSERATDALSILLCLLSAISFLLSGLKSFRIDHFAGQPGTGWAEGAPRSAYIQGGLALLLIAGVLINLLTRRRAIRKGTGATIRYRYWLFIAAIGWVGLTPLPWVGSFFVLLAFLEYQTKRPLEIGFDKDRIVINTLIKQRFDWTMFNNIVLKDGLLTLDFKNNKLFQKEVAEDEEDDNADEEEFNAWCRGRLMASN